MRASVHYDQPEIFGETTSGSLGLANSGGDAPARTARESAEWSTPARKATHRSDPTFSCLPSNTSYFARPGFSLIVTYIATALERAVNELMAFTGRAAPRQLV